MIALTPRRMLGMLAAVSVLFLPPNATAEQENREAVHFVESKVSFQTEDGWLIKGTLTRPAAIAEGESVPGVLLLHASSHDQDLFSGNGYPAFGRLQNRFITLRIDIRGRGTSEGVLELHSFTPQQLDRLYLDVKAALEFLGGQKGVDPFRVGIFAEEISANSAVLGMAGNPRVKVVVLISGRLSAKAKEVIAASPQVALLCVVSDEDREGFAAMTDAYKLSRNIKSDVLVENGLGVGMAMFSTWRYNRPQEKPLDDTVVDWMITRLNKLGHTQQVSFKTEDGWLISGDLVTPIGKVRSPAVILVHSSVTDRYMYHSLQQELIDNDLVVLNIDFRGRGKSRNRGDWLSLRLGSPAQVEESQRGDLDIKAAVDFLGSRAEVDPARIGLVGTVVGARFALLGASQDRRIKAAVALVGYVPQEAELKVLQNLQIPVLYIVSQNLVPVTRAMTDLYYKTKQYGSEEIVLKGGAYGYGVLTLNPELEPTIVNWMKKQISFQP
jgi:dienelactone hydrolase